MGIFGEIIGKRIKEISRERREKKYVSDGKGRIRENILVFGEISGKKRRLRSEEKRL